MIKIDRGDSPEILVKQGQAATNELRAQYENGERTFKFDAKIYGHETVKQALLRAQADKCCFCESRIVHIDYGDVEHYRPKAEVAQSTDDTPLAPGYYWLAYTWDNLLVSCAVCNQRHKRTLFPLFNPAARARTHLDDLNAEQPYFVSPADDDPARFISFRQEVAHPLRDSTRGSATIKALGLNREKLLEARRDRLAPLVRDLKNLELHTRSLAELRAHCPDVDEVREHIHAVEREVTALRNTLTQALLPRSEYSAMNRALCRAHEFQPVHGQTAPRI